MVDFADKKKSTLGVGINDAPIWLIEEFTRLAKSRYCDKYWVCLLDLMRKAEAWDVFVEQGTVPHQEPQSEVVEQKDDNPVVLMSGQKLKE